MKYYQELTLINSEKPFYEIWSSIYQQLHIALADIKNTHGIDNIGISFPNYRYEEKNGKTFATLGDKLRIFAQNKEALEQLNLNKWLERLIDYVHIKTICEVGNQAISHVVVKRYRYQNIEKKAKKFAKFKEISFEEALKHCQTYKQPLKHYPFINLKSETTQNPYKLAICQEVVDVPVVGTFNTYGINNFSNNVSVPHW